MSRYRSELRVPVERSTNLHNASYNNLFDQEVKRCNIRGPVDSPGSDYCLNGPRTYIHAKNGGSPTTFSEDDHIYADMKRRFEERRRQWESEFKHFHQRSMLSPNSSFQDFHRRFDWDHYPFESTLKQSISSRFERSPDEGVNYVVKFDLLNYDPEQVRVLVRDNQVIVTAKSEQLSVSNAATRDYKRTVNLPPGAEEEKITAYLAADGILSVSCPMRPPPFSSVNRNAGSMSDIHTPSIHHHHSNYSNRLSTRSPQNQIYTHRVNENLQEGSKATSVCSPQPTQSAASMSSTRLNEPGKSGELKKKPKFYLELPIDSDYAPTEIQIKTIDKRIHINARHEEKAPNRTSVREFSKEYDIPNDVNPESLTAKFINGMLYIEAQDFN